MLSTKKHTLDVKNSIPSFLYITNAKVHDVNILDIIPQEAGSFYIFDKAYINFLRLHNIHAKSSFFVTRAKDNMRFKRMYSRDMDKANGVLSDQIVKLETCKSSKEYPDKLCRIKFYDQELNQDFFFITNNTVLVASEISLLYKKRGEVEYLQMDETASQN